jgi:Zn-ribbon RNA-binding protein
MITKKKEESMTLLAGKGDRCMSCNTSVVNEVGAVKFNCPGCGKQQIIRCSKCRKTVAKYKCPGCGFEGPN